MDPSSNRSEPKRSWKKKNLISISTLEKVSSVTWEWTNTCVFFGKHLPKILTQFPLRREKENRQEESWSFSVNCAAPLVQWWKRTLKIVAIENKLLSLIKKQKQILFTLIYRFFFWIKKIIFKDIHIHELNGEMSEFDLCRYVGGTDFSRFRRNMPFWLHGGKKRDDSSNWNWAFM